MIISVPHCGHRAALRHFHQPAHHVDAFDKIICPLRDPAAVWQSWVNREGGREHIPLELFDGYWRRLADLDQKFDIEYIQMETSGIPVEGRLDVPDVRGVEKDLTWIYALPFVKRFYDHPSSH